MDRPKMYTDNNAMQRSNANKVLSTFIEKMNWKPDEVILEIGCGPGDVTIDILYQFLQNNIKQLVGVDKSTKMIEYANETYGCSKINFKVLDIENNNDCKFYSNNFDKVFSFFCFHWINNLLDSFNNVHLMLKCGGEILINLLVINPMNHIHKSLDEKWKKYIDLIKLNSTDVYSKDEITATLIKAGFRIISVELDTKKYIFPDHLSFINAFLAVDELSNVLPPHLFEEYHTFIEDKLCEMQMLEICPTTGTRTLKYNSITAHAIKD